MSQAGSVETAGSGPIPPEVATEYIANTGSAVPVANQLEIFGDIALAGTTPIETIASGNTVTTVVQLAQSNAFSSATTAGLASFDVSSFTVDANGFVTFSGTMSAIDSINVDASFVPGTDPVVPDGAGLITMTGRQVPNLSVGAQVLRSNSIAANSITYEIQQAGANATESTNYNGVCHFNSSEFTVSNGFVSLIGGSLAIDSIDVQATSGGGTDPVVPTVAGLVTFEGARVAAGTNPLRAVSTAANTVQWQIQTAQALAATDATKTGICNFDSADFTVDANGFVSLVGAGTGDVVGPAGATDNALVRFDGATGKLIKNGVVTEDNTGNISQSASVGGASLSILTSNTSNTASSTAFHQCQVAGATASDAYYVANINGGQAWSWGLDNSDSDAWVLSATSTPGTTNVMKVTTAGEITYPLQPAFLATSGDAANVTGDGTSFKIQFTSERYDQGGDYDGTDTFTAPVTGRYFLAATCSCEGILSTHTSIDYRIVTSNLSYNNRGGAPSKVFDANTRAAWIVSTDADMDVGDIADVRITINSGTKVVDIVGAGAGWTYFSGRLAC